MATVRRIVLVALMAMLLVPGVASARVAVDEDMLEDPAQEAVAREIMADIRCLVCQNQSIEDSNADLAQTLRQVVRERVSVGDDPDQVRKYLVDRYGDWVLMKPPLKGRTLLLWLAPVLFLGVGGVGLIVVIRKRQGTALAGAEPLSPEEETRLRQINKELGA